jgi:glutamate-1-semialdehyde 2,1-aminomutase
VTGYESATAANADHYAVFFRSMLEQGVYLPPSQFEALFVSLAHTGEHLEYTVRAAEKAFREVKKAI